MTQQEFEDLTGIATTPEDYERAELIYMSASKYYDKMSFCEAMKNTDNNAELLMFDLAKTITQQEKEMKRMDDQNRKEWEEQAKKDRLTALTLLQKAEWFFKHGHEDDGWDCEEMANLLIGRCELIKLKISEDINLTKQDLEYIERNLQ